ncbi:hypothetical protein GGI23_003762 [Coemansia sp. RSA 2559]|nr:hypothetical protein GGI23_003762 [Coemansia sp. RSA 2559]KAJ2862214.1 hypothetical protein GGI22_002250 [Coemansia erecta]
MSNEPDEPPRDATDSQDPTPGPTEKIVMTSTGVSNLFLVRRLLRESHGDKDNVVELLIQWMADDPDNPGQWWEAGGPADYAGPPVPQPAAAKTSKPDETVDLETADDAATLADDRSLSKCSTIVEESKKEPDATATQSLLADDQPVDKETGDQGQRPNAPQDRKKPVKGAARQKKAESKKRQKEMAKMKKRKAAREAAGSAKNTRGPGQNEEETALELSAQVSHIYI